MPRILITGMSGTGKTSLLAELARRGHLTVDTDDDGWILENGDWDASRMEHLLASRDDLVVTAPSVVASACETVRHPPLPRIPRQHVMLSRRLNARSRPR